MIQHTVAKSVGELDDLRHATKMLAQYDATLSEPDGCVVVEAALSGERDAVRKSVEVAVLEAGDVFVPDANAVGADLLIVADDDNLLGDVEEEQALNAQLACFIDDYQIISVRYRI